MDKSGKGIYAKMKRILPATKCGVFFYGQNIEIRNKRKEDFSKLPLFLHMDEGKCIARPLGKDFFQKLAKEIEKY